MMMGNRVAGIVARLKVQKFPTGRYLALALGACLLGQSAPLLAYIGPGAGISFLGSLFTMLLVGLVAIASVLFWPVRYLWRRWRKPPAVVNGNGESNQDSSDS
ncbi:MAG: hypothetical protein U1F68_16705 [Gammaproteobacteria bacterium]